jgi:hypothetical protein
VPSPSRATSIRVTIRVCYRWSGWLTHHLGTAATRIFTRVAAFPLLCVGVQIIITGLVDVVQTTRAGRWMAALRRHIHSSMGNRDDRGAQ